MGQRRWCSQNLLLAGSKEEHGVGFSIKTDIVSKLYELPQDRGASDEYPEHVIME